MHDLKVTWNIRVDKGIIEHILVTFLDVTHEKAMEQVAEGHRQELVLIDELVQVPAIKVAQFLETSLPLLKESEKLIQTADDLSGHTVKLLFVNAHTVKGAARSLGFKALAQVIHETEEVYSQILRHHESFARERLLADIQRVLARLESYVDINRNKLNRSEDLSKVTVDRERMELLHASLLRLADRSDLSMEQLIEAIDRQGEILSSMIFERSLPIFEDYRERALAIARDLGKAEPEVILDIEDFSLSPALQTTLNRCMIHFLRNALDHGIEPPDERVTRGKSPTGRIEMLCRLEDRRLVLALRDDGRGLALKSLREKAALAGRPVASMSPTDIAHLIFEGGFSTAHAVSDISGRGVGLHAVRSFVEKQGGTIALQLEGPLDPSGDYYRFQFLIQLPLIALEAPPADPALAKAV